MEGRAVGYLFFALRGVVAGEVNGPWLVKFFYRARVNVILARRGAVFYPQYGRAVEFVGAFNGGVVCRCAGVELVTAWCGLVR